MDFSTMSDSDGHFQDVRIPEGKLTVWTYYWKNSKEQTAKCKFCEKVLKTTGGSTKGLHDHLKRHGVSVYKRPSTSYVSQDIEHVNIDVPSDKVKKPNAIEWYIQKPNHESFEAVVSRMVALDGLPFSAFCTSTELRSCLEARGFQNIPTSPVTIRQTVMDFADLVLKLQREEIANQQRLGVKFNVTLEEWFSNRNRGYINICLSENFTERRMWNLGLVRIHGSCSAIECLEIIQKKLMEYNLTLQSDIISIVFDSTNLTKKVGSLSPTYQQLCFAQGAQLAVLDVLYTREKSSALGTIKRVKHEESEMEIVGKVDFSEGNTGKSGNESDSDREEVDEVSGGIPIEFVEETGEDEGIHHDHLPPVFHKVRQIVKLFKMFPTVNDSILQQYVNTEYGEDIPLILDGKTRWTSLYAMLERFVKLKKCVLKSLGDLKSPISLTPEELQFVEKTVEALAPIKACVEALCRKDANLLVADASLKFAINKLEKQSSKLSKELASALRNRTGERRLGHSSVLQYLHRGKDKSQGKDETFVSLGPQEMFLFLKDLINRLSPYDEKNNELEVQETQTMYNETGNSSNEEKKMKTETEKELDDIIKETLSAGPNVQSLTRSFPGMLQKEISLFDAEGVRGTFLNTAYTFLKSIPPTCVESEHAFSTSSCVSSKIRSKLNDDTLDSICRLRSYFQNISYKE